MAKIKIESFFEVFSFIILLQPTILQADPISQEHICKAAIATIMGRDPSIIKIDKIQNDIIYLSYIRRDDGTLWTYKCKLNGNNVIWGNADGRWRTEEIIKFTVSGNSVSITDTTTSSNETYQF